MDSSVKDKTKRNSLTHKKTVRSPEKRRERSPEKRRSPYKKRYQSPDRQRNAKYHKDDVLDFPKKKFQAIGSRLGEIGAKFSKDMNIKNFVPAGYKNIQAGIEDDSIKKLIKTLPLILLAITVIIIKNKTVFFPVLAAYKSVSSNRSLDNESILNRITAIISAYINIIKQGGAIKTMSVGLSTLTLFLDDIPNMLYNTTKYPTIDAKIVLPKIIKNALEIEEEFITKPAREQKRIDDEKAARNKMINMQNFILKMFPTSRIPTPDQTQPTDDEIVTNLLNTHKSRKSYGGDNVVYKKHEVNTLLKSLGVDTTDPSNRRQSANQRKSVNVKNPRDQGHSKNRNQPNTQGQSMNKKRPYNRGKGNQDDNIQPYNKKWGEQ